jgi:choline dehydrogenase-like flavoprotein
VALLGVRTLVLVAGRPIVPDVDYTEHVPLWEMPYRGLGDRRRIEERQRVQRRSVSFDELSHVFWTDDVDSPYSTPDDKPFDWFRARQVGGKSIIWGRQVYRLSDLDFEANLRDGIAVDWPIRYKDLEKWYAHVEKFAGIAGNRDGLDVLPDSVVMPAIPLNCVEEYFGKSLKKHFGGSRHLIAARCAHITDPQPVHAEQGRSRCLHMTMCNRGCNLGAYFSSNSSTLPWAMKTGNLTIRPDSVVHSIIYDDQKEKVTGVRIVDRHTKEMLEFYAGVIFVNASALNSNAILLNSTSRRFPDGLGNDNGLLGRYVSWHNYRGRAGARVEGFEHKKTSGRRPSYAYIPNFRNVYKQEMDFLRGYAIGVSAGRGTHSDTGMIGHQLRENLLNPRLNDTWYISTWLMGECVPQESNHVRLHPDQKDKYGIPQLVISCEWSENDEKLTRDYLQQIQVMFDKAGFIDIEAEDTGSPPGADIHEMGGVRMGKDPETSLLNRWNQVHHAKNVFVTDGACMTSTGTQNPTLTFMAITARAANYAAEQLKKGNL